MAYYDKYYIAEVLEDLVKNQLNGISDYCYPEHRPTVMQDQMQDMVVIGIASSTSNNVCQNGRLRVELSARNKSNGISNTKRLQQMLDAVCEKMPIVTDRYSVTRPTLTLKGDDGLGFTHWLMTCNLRVNTIDNYKY